MECRLCLRSASASYFVPIDAYSDILEKHVWRCREQKDMDQTSLPDTICLSCEYNLKSLVDFKQTCIQNDEAARLRPAKSFDVKVEEVLLDDLVFEDHALDTISPLQFVDNVDNCSNEIIDGRSSLEENSNVDELSSSNDQYNTERRCSPINGEILNTSDTGEQQHKCEICLKLFARRWNLKQHMNIHTGEKPYKCEVCLKTFGKNSCLNRHMKYHTGEKAFKCEICSRCFVTNSDLKIHNISSHNGKKLYKCKICSKFFAKNWNLNHHMKYHTGEKAYKCHMCSKSFVTNGDLKIHIMSIHTGEKPYKCGICSKRFIRSGRLAQHMKYHTKDKEYGVTDCRLCLNSTTAESSVPIEDYSYLLSQHIWSFHQPQVKQHDQLPGRICLSCESSLKSFINFKKICCQNDVAARPKPTECLDIKEEDILIDDLVYDVESFDIASSIYNPTADDQSYEVQLTTDEEISPKQIDTNEHNTEQKYSLMDDKISKTDINDTEEKQFECKVCSKRFSKKSNLKQHVNIHTGERKHECNICAKRFVNSNDLRRHNMKYHTGEKPFKCELCSKCFPTMDDLKIHIMSVHTEEKLFICEVCSKCFVKSWNFKQHMLIHTGVKPFKCEICSKFFVKSSVLTRHIKKCILKN